MDEYGKESVASDYRNSFINYVGFTLRVHSTLIVYVIKSNLSRPRPFGFSLD